jgi:hypothetical protein
LFDMRRRDFIALLGGAQYGGVAPGASRPRLCGGPQHCDGLPLCWRRSRTPSRAFFAARREPGEGWGLSAAFEGIGDPRPGGIVPSPFFWASSAYEGLGQHKANKFGPRLQSAKGRHSESAPNEKQVLQWQTFAFPQGPLDARAAHFVRHADLTANGSRSSRRRTSRRNESLRCLYFKKQRRETSPSAISASGRGRCRAAGRVADRAGADLSILTCENHRRLGGQRVRHRRAFLSAEPLCTRHLPSDP